jgi:lipopolysaccharide/colanic/teichoic acid biosynthesis glycosyltransferase
MLAPIMLGIGVLIRRKLGAPIFFRQSRPGHHHRQFMMWKFRTMSNTCDDMGILLPDYDRHTRFGDLLRSTSLDELPELWNVLKGEMSLVGPRPLLARYEPFYTPTEQERFNVRPGITGWAQVHGRNTLSWDERLALDVWYVRNASFALDLRIAMMTLASVLRRSGMVTDPTSTMLDLDVERLKKQ